MLLSELLLTRTRDGPRSGERGPSRRRYYSQLVDSEIELHRELREARGQNRLRPEPGRECRALRPHPIRAGKGGDVDSGGEPRAIEPEDFCQPQIDLVP